MENLNKFLNLLNTFDERAKLVSCSFRLLIYKYENPGVLELGKPPNRVENGCEIGPTAEEGFVIVRGFKFTFDKKVSDVIKEVQKLLGLQESISDDFNIIYKPDNLCGCVDITENIQWSWKK